MKTKIEEVENTKNGDEDNILELQKKLDAANKKYKDLKENLCLDDIQAVLTKHGCTLAALPDGRFQVIYQE